jgi:prepilin-type processing-associated H-X9-DG protein
MQPVEKQKFGCLAKSLLGIGVLFVLFCFGIFGWPFGPSQKDMAKQYSCLSGVRQIIGGCEIYASDNDDAFPPYYTFEGTQPATNFRDSVRNYLKNDEVYVCPSDPSVWAPPDSVGTFRKPLPGAMSHVHSNSLQGVIPEYSAGKRVIKVSQIGSPETTVYMRDPIFSGPDGAYSFHGKGIMIGYLDGHVKYRTPVVWKDYY